MNNQKVAIITGATDGIGKQTALGLLKSGFEVCIVGRDETKAQKVKAELEGAIKDAKINYAIADLSSQNQIKKLAEEIIAKYTRIDVLINNAASVTSERILTEDGFERQLAVNHLAYFLLTYLLLDKIIATPNSRIINVASGAHYGGTLDIQNLNAEIGSYNGFKVYSNTKLYNVLFTVELAERLKDKGVTVNCLHPGVVQTNLANKETKTFLSVIWNIFKSFGIKPDKGAETSIYLATSDEVKNTTGKYFEKCKEKRPKSIVYNENLRKQFWAESEKMCNIQYPI